MRWQLLRYAPFIEVAEPLGVYRLVNVTEIDGYTDILVDDNIEDPAVSEFFVVLKDLGKNEWLCYYQGQYAYCQRLTMDFKGDSVLDVGYFYCPYTPILPPPVVDQTAVDKTKGILTRYGKKILKHHNGH